VQKAACRRLTGDSVSYKATDDSTESGTMTWGESSKTRGRYTGW
jgi:hypothetical protein